MSKSVAILIPLLFALSVNAQDWCKNKPAKLDKPPSTFQDKLINDRLNHTIHPDILRYRETQVEIATMLKPEAYGNDAWLDNDTTIIYSVYSAYALKHSFIKNLELQVSLTDVMLKASEEIRAYGKENLNTSISVGAKYHIYYSERNYFKLSIFGQLTIPKFKNTTSTFFSPELRILMGVPVTSHLMLTCNIGGVYINNSAKTELVYAFNLKRNIGRRMELFAEFYKECLKTGPARNPNKRWLMGTGYYFLENLYLYSSFEGGWEHKDSLNGGRIDIGLTCRIN